jgi:hypothetical protein
LERLWWQLFWQLRRQYMPVEVMADIVVTLVGMLSEDMPQPATLGADTLASVLAVGVVTSLHEPRADSRALQGAHTIGMAAVIGEAVTGEAITGIRPMDILGSDIMVWAMAIHTTGLVITVTATVGTIHTTDIGDTTLTSTDTGHP